MRKPNPFISVIVPCFNESDNIDLLAKRIGSVVGEEGLEFEIILVDDGSTDESLSIIKSNASLDPRIRWVSFSRNFGHEAATSCGFTMAKGDIAVLMDADLQDPPELIPEMLQRW